MKLSAILLAGGIGSRLGGPVPKQFMSLQGKAMVLHSLDVIAQIPEIEEIIVVSDPQYHSLFSEYSVGFAMPGVLRQDSVFNALQKVSSTADWVLVHDGARPFITTAMIQRLLAEGAPTGAATLAVPVKNTLKRAHTDQHVDCTLDRSQIWEIQTPQLLKKEVLEAGFREARSRKLTVTDDVALAELIHHPVKLVMGDYQNIKITTPEDWAFAEWTLHRNTVSV